MNSSHAKLVKDHFNQKYKDYDTLIRKLIPKYEEMHHCVLDAVEVKISDPQILDLGIGSGQTATGLLQKFPNAYITGVDFSEKMLAMARFSLVLHLDQAHLIKADIRDYTIAQNYDVCVGVLSIHHLYEEEKTTLFHRVYQYLNKGGVFVIGDIIKFDTDEETKEKEDLWKNFLIKNLGTQEGSYWFDNYLEEDIPSSVSTHLRLLKKAGFSDVTCVWNHLNYAVIKAQKD